MLSSELLAFGLAGGAIHISWSKCCLSVCLCVFLDANQGGTNPLHTETFNLASTGLLMSPDHAPKTRSV